MAEIQGSFQTKGTTDIAENVRAKKDNQSVSLISDGQPKAFMVVTAIDAEGNSADITLKGKENEAQTMSSSAANGSLVYNVGPSCS